MPYHVQRQPNSHRRFLDNIRELEPYEVLIGRDLMSEMILHANFKTGDWSLSWG